FFPENTLGFEHIEVCAVVAAHLFRKERGRLIRTGRGVKLFVRWMRGERRRWPAGGSLRRRFGGWTHGRIFFQGRIRVKCSPRERCECHIRSCRIQSSGPPVRVLPRPSGGCTASTRWSGNRGPGEDCKGSGAPSNRPRP